MSLWRPVLVTLGILSVVRMRDTLPVLPDAILSSGEQAERPVPIANHDPLENIDVEMPTNNFLIEGDVWISRPSPRAEYPAITKDAGLGARVPSINSHQSRNSLDSPEMLWMNQTVPYQFDVLLNETELLTVREAISDIQGLTGGDCVKFVPKRPSDRDFIYITSRNTGCFSKVGRQGGNQTVTVSRVSACVTRGIVMHELLHALGFWHEHTRIDRDEYIEVVELNILYNHKTDFHVNKNAKILVPEYDYYSVMHCKTNQFSISDNLKTVRIKDPTVNEALVGQRLNLSSKDVLRIKLLFGCDTQLTKSPSSRDIDPSIEDLFGGAHFNSPESTWQYRDHWTSARFNPKVTPVKRWPTSFNKPVSGNIFSVTRNAYSRGTDRTSRTTRVRTSLSTANTKRFTDFLLQDNENPSLR
ncbi:zinc metalloproteinase nas-14-like isoform X2 [Mya arenaria]|uniref:zinc metalloproteinase nas-14-like isoform X2 n=1 Tax=Mya arenaria TaxID=6604 RepID=UPI0022E03450|nr:zinc metalloproteinase nas-14-like isoform X2 [Mya arenaria]